jgi:hypothetical protein
MIETDRFLCTRKLSLEMLRCKTRRCCSGQRAEDGGTKKEARLQALARRVLAKAHTTQPHEIGN